MTSKQESIAIHTMQATIAAMQSERTQPHGALEDLLSSSPYQPASHRAAMRAKGAIAQAREEVPTHA